MRNSGSSLVKVMVKHATDFVENTFTDISGTKIDLQEVYFTPLIGFLSSFKLFAIYILRQQTELIVFLKMNTF